MIHSLMSRKYFRETLFFIVLQILCLVFFYDLYRPNIYEKLWLLWLQAIILVYCFRFLVQYVYYAQVFSGYIKFFTILGLIVGGMFFYFINQDIAMMLDEMNLSQIFPRLQVKISDKSVYDVFMKLKTFHAFFGFGSVAFMYLLAFRILLSYLGYDSEKMKQFIQKKV